MRISRLSTALLSLLGLVASWSVALPEAGADEQASDAPAGSIQAAAQPDPDPRSAVPHVGLLLDVGAPDAANLALVIRPHRAARVELGGGYNGVAPGARAGLTVIPFGWGPSFTLEGGHYFEGNANAPLRSIIGTSYRDHPSLNRVGYDYANAHLGFELGLTRATFFLHAGMSYVRSTVHDLGAELAASSGNTSGTSQITVSQDPTLSGFVPSAKLGFIVYLD